MIPKRVTVENFLSFGPKTEIHFSDDEPLWVLGGQNGIGKSAVFDAMTYCLFAQHRGGVDNADALIHHGRDRFSVSFEFEFDGADYCIRRNRSPSGPTQSVERRIEGRWKRIEGVDGVASVKQWVIDTLGLNFASFQASVLLRQGEAEAILTATGRERMTILKSVLGLERFETLSADIGERTKAKKAELKSFKEKRNALTEATAPELAGAEIALQRAGEAKADSIAARDAASTGMSRAKLWEEVEPKRFELERKLSEAVARSADAERIRRQFAEYGVLKDVLPILRQLVPLQAELVDAEPALVRLRAACEAADAERQRLDSESGDAEARRIAVASESTELARRAKESRQEIARQTKFLTAADEVGRLGAELDALPTGLAEETAEARVAEEIAKETHARSLEASTRQSTLLRQASELQAKFADLSVGVDCSACGQKVTAEHAAKERGAAEENATRLRGISERCDSALAEVARTTKEASAHRVDLEGKLRSRDALAAQLESKRNDLESFGGTSDISRLQAQIAELTKAAEAAEGGEVAAKAELGQLDLVLARLAAELHAAEQLNKGEAVRFTALEKSAEAGRIRCATLLEQLRVERHGTTSAKLTELEASFAELEAGKIAEEFAKFQQDETRQDEWRTQLGGLALQIDAIPQSARRTLREAEESHDGAAKLAIDADATWQTARDALADLQRRAKAFTDLCAEILAAERAALVHAKLNDLIGNTGLLRELVRIAEEEIVRFADDSLQKLSDGDLSLELSREPKKEGEALVLLVRSADSAEPTEVNFLSGSQKFRVALAIALGIGQFASGQTRPLESVIIDEGFGSLDKNGLRAAAEELSRLKRHLKRIILVSHQEEFTDHFPVVIRLEKTDDGVKATTIRR